MPCSNGIQELYGWQYDGVDIREEGDQETHILYEDFGNYVYVHEWRNRRKDNSGFKLGIRFLEKHPTVVCSSINPKTDKTFKRYGFREFKEVGKRKYYIRARKEQKWEAST